MHASTAEQSILDSEKFTQLLRMIEMTVFIIGYPRNMTIYSILDEDDIGIS